MLFAILTSFLSYLCLFDVKSIRGPEHKGQPGQEEWVFELDVAASAAMDLAEDPVMYD